MEAKNKIPERVNEAVVRATALEIFLLAVAYLYWRSPILLYILAGDFFLRAFTPWPISPFGLFAKHVLVKILPFKRRLIAKRPKRFAAGIGFFMSLGAAVFSYFSLYQLSFIFIAILALFSSLEAFLRFCAGCKIFGLLIKIGLFKEDLCEDCVFPGGEGI